MTALTAFRRNETPEPPMRIAHGIFALGVIAIFLALHLANHLTSSSGLTPIVRS
jgi:hypothetical protein